VIALGARWCGRSRSSRIFFFCSQTLSHTYSRQVSSVGYHAQGGVESDEAQEFFPLMHEPYRTHILGGPTASGVGRAVRKVVWKVMKLKNIGASIREWRAVRAVRESVRASGGSAAPQNATFGPVLNAALLKDLLKPPKGELPSAG